MSHFLTVASLLSGIALAAALPTVPMPYQMTQTRVQGLLLLVLAETSRPVPGMVVGQPTLQTTTLLVARDSRTGQTRWKRYLGERWSLMGLGGGNVAVQQAIPGGTRTRLYAASDGRLLQGHEVYRATPTTP